MRWVRIMKLLRCRNKIAGYLFRMQIYLLGELQFGLLSFSNAYQVHGGVVLLVLTTLQPLLELLRERRGNYQMMISPHDTQERWQTYCKYTVLIHSGLSPFINLLEIYQSYLDQYLLYLINIWLNSCAFKVSCNWFVSSVAQLYCSINYIAPTG